MTSEINHHRACFVWYRIQPAMVAAAHELASRGWAISIITGEPFNPPAGTNFTIRVLRDDVLLDQPPRQVEAYPTPQVRFAVAACDMVIKLETQGRFAYIEYAAADGAGWTIAESRRTMNSFAHATLGVYLSHLEGTLRAHDEQHWLTLGDGIRERIEHLSLGPADTAIAPTHAIASAQGWRGAPPIIRRVATMHTRAFPSGHAHHAIVPGPIQHHHRTDTVVRAALDLLGQNHDLFLTVEGPDTDTGPLGDSCAARINRYLPESVRQRISVAGAPSHASPPGIVILAGTTTPDHTTFLHAASGGTRLLVADAPEHRELAAATSRPDRFEWFAPGDHTALAALLGTDRTAPPQIAPEGFTSGIQELVDLVAARATATPAPTAPHAAAIATGAPAVSVVVPHFNLAAFLPDTLASIHAQTHKDFELIVIDDGSTDAASQLLLEGLERNGVNIIRRSNGGLGNARNAGLTAAKAPWVLMLDADDIIHPLYLELALAAAERVPSAAAIGSFMRCFTQQPEVATGGWLPLGLDRDLLANANFACTASCLLRKDAVLSVGGYDERLVSFEDWDLWCSLAARDFEALIIPEFLLFYRQRPDSMYHAMARRNEANLRSQLLVRHPDLCTNWSRAMRIELAMRHHFEFGDRAPTATKPLRYILADRMNSALKRIGVHAAVKRSLGGITGLR